MDVAGTISVQSNQSGFSLIEGMLAAVILGTGLLALAGMQSIALVRNVDANELTRVTTLASDMMERIQYNRRNAFAYNGIDTQSPVNCNSIDAALQPMARGDCLQWDSLVDNFGLENIRGQVSVDLNPIQPISLNQRNVTVTITWLGSMNSDSSLKRTRTVTVRKIIAPE